VKSNRMARWIAAMTAITAAAMLAFGAASAEPEPLSAFPQSLLAIRTSAGRVINFKIWTADRPSRQEQGLMFVRDMDEHAGMLFVFPTSQRVAMWMKNTYVSLDMLFLDDQGRIDYIAARTTPLSLDIIQAPRPSTAVLELVGGAAERLGIRAGDQVLSESLGTKH
jgi:uncharacterized membrane protein (UPF0127 family)